MIEGERSQIIGPYQTTILQRYTNYGFPFGGQPRNHLCDPGVYLVQMLLILSR